VSLEERRITVRLLPGMEESKAPDVPDVPTQS
jgi:hypothetical protein